MSTIWTANWTGIMLLEDMMLPNNYEMDIDFDLVGEDPHEQWIAFERIKAFTTDIIDGSLFAKVDNPFIPMLHKSTKSNIITLAEEPIDMIIGLSIMRKLDAITEDRAMINLIAISSDLGEHVKNTVSHDEMLTELFVADNVVKKTTGNDPWWLRADAGCTDLILQNKKKVLVKHDKVEWSKYDLDWTPKEENSSTNTETVLKYPKGKMGWKPKIIDGGRD